MTGVDAESFAGIRGAAPMPHDATAARTHRTPVRACLFKLPEFMLPPLAGTRFAYQWPIIDKFCVSGYRAIAAAAAAAATQTPWVQTARTRLADQRY